MKEEKITIQDISNLFHLPLHQACIKLGRSKEELNKICRAYGKLQNKLFYPSQESLGGHTHTVKRKLKKKKETSFQTLLYTNQLSYKMSQSHKRQKNFLKRKKHCYLHLKKSSQKLKKSLILKRCRMKVENLWKFKKQEIRSWMLNICAIFKI
jgi:hypothetical protein